MQPITEGTEGILLSQILVHARADAPRVAGKALAVDDEPGNVKLITSLLTRGGYRVVTASNGEEALEMIASEHPDLVLMDVLMPQLSGYDV